MRNGGANESIGDAAYRRIRADILFGRLAPGQRLRLERMKDAYGASINTLRELLNRLSSEGLVTAEGLRGFEVAPISVADLREVAAMRLLLERHAWAKFAPTKLNGSSPSRSCRLAV